MVEYEYCFPVDDDPDSLVLFSKEYVSSPRVFQPF